MEKNLANAPDYVCEITDELGASRVGLINLINYRCYPDKIAPHENFNPQLSQLYASQFLNLGELINPIVLFYRGDNKLSSCIRDIILNKPQWKEISNNNIYKIWVVPPRLKYFLFEHINSLSMLYVADGHHRIQALKVLNEKLREDSNGFYMSFLLHESQIDIQNYDRYYYIETDALRYLCNKLSLLVLLKQDDFSCREKPQPRICFLINGKWYYGFVKNKSINLLTLTTFLDEIVSGLSKKGKVLKEDTVFQKDIPSKEKYYKQNNFNFMVIFPRIKANEIEECKKLALLFPKNSTCIFPKFPDRLFVSNLKNRKIRVNLC